MEFGRQAVEATSGVLAWDVDNLLVELAGVAEPDVALREFLRIWDKAPESLVPLTSTPGAIESLLRVLGGSIGLADFLFRHPESLSVFLETSSQKPSSEPSCRRILSSVNPDNDEFARIGGDAGRDSLRIAYRRELTRIAAYDLSSNDPTRVVTEVSQFLADIAAAALEASLSVARKDLVDGGIDREMVKSTELAVIAMGKCGAQELNYLSDVDVIFVAGSKDEGHLATEERLSVATKLAQLLMRGISESSKEPGLWEVDANLRPEGKAGALVRTLESHLAYYDRWAKNWEFQALLKARAAAGSSRLGNAYVSSIAPYVWASAQRSGFVDQVQRMRERVTEHIPQHEVDWQIKLGPGGLRDIEFTVQLLQLVHGKSDSTLRTRGTIESLMALRDGGYVGRTEAEAFIKNYEFLRVLEHRLQLRKMSRTHLMPSLPEDQRVLARSAGFDSAVDLMNIWSDVKVSVRQLHERLFYRPLLAAVASLPEEGMQLTAEQAQDRLSAIGFADPKSALAHVAALTGGVSRRSSIQRALLPILLQWFSEGADPDSGLVAFRRLSETLGETHWYLRMLRDGKAAAARLARILSGSRFITDLIEHLPEAVAWLDDDSELMPRDEDSLRAESESIINRHDDMAGAVAAIRSIRRREVLRIAMGAITDVCSMSDIQIGLTAITRVSLDSFLTLAMRDVDAIDFGVIGMGRFGGGELGFGSDADVLFVYRVKEGNGKDQEDVELVDQARREAETVAHRLTEFCADPRLELELDLDLRPEGKNGPKYRSLESYAAYYERWSEVWESQALLRAMPVAGEPRLLTDFMQLVDQVRFGSSLTESDAREIRRIKARIEKERLPQGADPARHLKLGRGSLSDIEWTIQLIQLRHGNAIPALQTSSTLRALNVAVAHDLITASDASKLEAAWVLSSRIRSALVLWGSMQSDILPSDINDLDGIARLLGYEPGKARFLEDDYLSISRRARSVCERLFYGDVDVRRSDRL